MATKRGSVTVVLNQDGDPCHTYPAGTTHRYDRDNVVVKTPGPVVRETAYPRDGVLRVESTAEHRR